MVAFSMYRGNLHRVPPNPPRQWPMPPPAISLTHFRRLMEKRSQALSRLPAAGGLETQEEELRHEEGVGDNGCPPSDASAAVEPQIAPQPKVQEGEGAAVVSQELQAGVAACAPETPKGTAEETGVTTEVINNMDVDTHKENRRMELEKKLKVLNEKKHNLVQMLKQILNAEEEIKRRSIRSPSIHACPLQVETAADMGSVTRHAQKISVEVNFGGDMGGEQDAAANHNVLPCSLHPMQITSPSATSHLRTNHGPQHNAVPNNHRMPLQGKTTPSGVTGTASSSPFRFGPTTQQGHATSLPAVSVPGTNYCPSTPSPAGLGGASSVFKDPHRTSSL